jgi:hypothetical protein
MKLILVLFAALLLSLSIGCRGIGIAFVDQNSEPLVPEAGNGWLMFDLLQVRDNGNTRTFVCSYQSGDKIARFKFDVEAGELSGFPPTAAASGKFIAVSGSDASIFLQNLKKALEAKSLPRNTVRVSELPFAAVILGTTQSHSKDGGFFTEPAGNWTVMKIFIGKKDDPGEVFLNFNTVLHKGEFSIKDPDYGDGVLKELSKVL